jgi:hypothetical protein
MLSHRISIVVYRCSLFCQFIWPIGFALQIDSVFQLLAQAKQTLSPDRQAELILLYDVSRQYLSSSAEIGN